MTTATLELTEQQILTLFQQLEPATKRAVLYQLAPTLAERSARMAFTEQRLRSLADQRGINWESLSDQQREDFIDDLVHESEG